MSPPAEITDSEQESAFIRNNVRGVIFYGSAACPHCRSIAPLYEDLANKHNQIAFAHVETSLVDVEGLDGVPTFVAYKEGKAVDHVVGANSAQLISMVEAL